MRASRVMIALGLVAAAVWWSQRGADPPAPAADAVAESPRDALPSPLLQAARGLIDEARYDDALALLAARSDEARAELACLTLWIDLERHLGEPARAVELGEEAAARWPESVDAWLALSRALGTRMQRATPQFMAVRWMGDWRAAVDRAVELTPHGREARVAQIGFLVYAPALVGGDLEQAQRLCDDLAPHDPAAAAMMRALALQQSGDAAAGLVVAREAAVDAPDDQELGIVHGSLAATAGRSAEALAAFDRVLAGPVGPPWYRALFYRARELVLRRQELEQAVADLERYLERAPPADYMPTPAEALEQLGRAWERLDRRDEARTAYERSLTEEPGRKSVLEALERLR